MAKKFINKNVFLCHNLEFINCEILTKNLVTFKRWGGVKDEKLWFFFFFWLGGEGA